jgi:uncharacterized Tic20 family protein
MAYCATCEKDGGSGKFCGTCGKQISAPAVEPKVTDVTNTSAGKSGMWAHLGAILLVLAGYVSFFPWFVLWLPGLILRSSRSATEFDRRHATESLNFQLTALALFGVFVIGDIVILALGAGGFAPAGPIFIVYGLTTLAIVFIFQWVGVVFAIVGSIAASNLKEYRYPISYRFVK